MSAQQIIKTILEEAGVEICDDGIIRKVRNTPSNLGVSAGVALINTLRKYLHRKAPLDGLDGLAEVHREYSDAFRGLMVNFARDLNRCLERERVRSLDIDTNVTMVVMGRPDGGLTLACVDASIGITMRR